ncbi:hypothetical protein [Thiomicrospira sp. WB1]|uniref:hypothetical protein n=1 Tax=Thiomicrospira sp. WB1 TaxID=1685380 RepID=UPI000749AA71|nr:hypothetical protein [Thiomicrospira sp. WB1]KUJ72949.1 hypothetical protein AVO41_04045 [Thiomicrospira sp. WB1]
MILEAWQWLTTPATPLARRSGLLKEAIAMQARCKRCEAAWQPHYQRCQQAIREAMAQSKRKRILMVMGAGLLQDIPLHQASEAFEQVWLVDMVFLRSARRLVRDLPNVRLIECDLTESLTGLFSGRTDIVSPQRFLDEPIDCVVSLNVLTQLPLTAIRPGLHRNLEEAELEKMGQALIQAHLEYLSKFDAVRCLICDRWVAEYDAQGQCIDELDPAWGVRLPAPDTTWLWQVIPRGESTQAPGHERTHKVGRSIW